MYQVPANTPAGVINAVSATIIHHTKMSVEVTTNVSNGGAKVLLIAIPEDLNDRDVFHLGVTLGLALGMSTEALNDQAIADHLNAHATQG